MFQLYLLLRLKKYANVRLYYGQELTSTTYNLARMNMLLHGLKDTEFEIHHGDTLINDWNILNEMNPAKKIRCYRCKSPFQLTLGA